MAPKRLIFLPVMALLVVGLCAGETSALKLLKTISLPGVTGRFDHFALDIKGHRLFVAALGNNTLEAIDLSAGQRVQSIPGLGKPTGVLFLPDLNRLFVACGDDGNVRVFDADTLRLLKTISGLDDADNMRFDAKAGLIYVGYGSSALAVIDAAKAENIGNIPLAGHPESFQLEKNGGRILVNVPDAQHIAVVDRGRGAVEATWPMADFKANFPMALDETDQPAVRRVPQPGAACRLRHRGREKGGGYRHLGGYRRSFLLCGRPQPLRLLWRGFYRCHRPKGH